MTFSQNIERISITLSILLTIIYNNNELCPFLEHLFLQMDFDFNNNSRFTRITFN